MSVLGKILRFNADCLTYGSGSIFPELSSEMWECIYQKDRRTEYYYWDTNKLDSLPEEKLSKFLWALKRIQWIEKKVCTHEVVKFLCDRDVGCEIYHMFRMGNLAVYYHLKQELETRESFQKLRKLPIHTEIPDELLSYDLTEDFKVKILDPIKKAEDYAKMISNLSDEQPSQVEIFKKLQEELKTGDYNNGYI
jgi:hypothetical protein